MRIYYFIIISVLLFAFISCTPKVSQVGSYYSYSTKCLGSELDGSETLLAWGEGRNRADAVEQAKKNALRDVIFNGIHDGNSLCDKIPVINVPNSKDRFEE